MLANVLVTSHVAIEQLAHELMSVKYTSISDSAQDQTAHKLRQQRVVHFCVDYMLMAFGIR